MFFRKKRLHELDPKTLSMEALLVLQSGLLAKLLLVTKELKQRYAILATTASEMKMEENSTFDFEKEAKRMNGICLIVENMLAQQIGKAPQP